MLRPVSEVADVETQLRLAGRYVDPVFQHSRRHYVGFVLDLVKAGSVGFVEDAVEHVGLFFVAKKAGAHRLMADARASNRHFVRPPSGPLLTREAFCFVEFQEHQKTLRTGLWVRPISRTRFTKCAFLHSCRGSLHSPLFSHPKLDAREKGPTKNVLLPSP